MDAQETTRTCTVAVEASEGDVQIAVDESERATLLVDLSIQEQVLQGGPSFKVQASNTVQLVVPMLDKASHLSKSVLRLRKKTDVSKQKQNAC